MHITTTPWFCDRGHKIEVQEGSVLYTILILKSGIISVFRHFATHKTKEQETGQSFHNWKEVHDHYKRLQPGWEAITQAANALPPVHPDLDYAS